ncbi:excalibur calcium-binding domain-containing protein [Nitrincola alkalilacustris]|uniref:excalibur calcium-binding domain-containing protein n=1 Tax=Nitrincola alkalilacustris TaxID=1571224 RepID=UPI001F0E7270|nr:excalibur calcium-binding domain-containing protein [Nitrincola alkalilacustris]
MSEIAIYIGLGIFVIGGLGLLIAAFRTSILWGLAVLFIAPVAIIYLIFHWQDAKGPFKLQVFGFAIMAVFLYMGGGMSPVTSGGPSLAGEIIEAPASSYSNFSTRSVPNQQFKCDGRTHCSQMTSCAEATYFLRNCPNTKMDGNNDGIPCERQWCR